MPVLRAIRNTLSIVAVMTGAVAADDVAKLILAGDLHDAAGRSHEALEAYRRAEVLAPTDPILLLKISKQHGDIIPQTRQPELRAAASRRALIYARRGLRLAPECSNAHLAVAIALGKATEFQTNREKVHSSREIRLRAEEALRLDPANDYAHHVLGRWHQELASVSPAMRALVRAIYGKMPAASHEAALVHFRAARSLRSDRLIHQIEYGRTLAMLGRTDEARHEILKGLEMPDRDADDPDTKYRGRQTLKQLS